MLIVFIHVEWDSYVGQQTRWIGWLHYVYGEYKLLMKSESQFRDWSYSLEETYKFWLYQTMPVDFISNILNKLSERSQIFFLRCQMIAQWYVQF